MRLRLGIDDCYAVKRWPRPEDWIPIVRDRLGLRLVQHSLDLVPTAAPVGSARSLAAAVGEAGLELHSTFTGLAAYSSNLLLDPDAGAREAASAWFRWAIDWTAAAGGRMTGGHVGAFAVADWVAPDRRRARWASLQDGLAALAAHARLAGLEALLVENLAAAREPSTMSMIRDLISDGDGERVPVRLCLDVGHMCVPGTSGPERDPYAWLRQLGPDSPVIQLQQSDADGDHHWPFTAARNAAGRIDADRVIDALGEGGVEETALILEIIPPFEQADDEVLTDLEDSVGYWRDALARYGLDSA
jgi:hypothetical protein